MHAALNRSVTTEDTGADIYLERITVYQVHNRWLRLALAAASVVILVLAGANYKLSKTYSTLKPLVIRVNDVGAADAVSYASMEYQPREMEVRHFLMNFVQDHYSRNRRRSGTALSGSFISSMHRDRGPSQRKKRRPKHSGVPFKQ